MKTYKIYTWQRRGVDKRICDICGNEIDDWVGDDEHKITIEHKITNRWDLDMFDKFSPDICHGCFINKIIPALKAMGIPIEYKVD